MNRIQIHSNSSQHLFLCFDFPKIYDIDLDLLVRGELRRIRPKSMDIIVQFSNAEARGSVNMSGDNFYSSPNIYQIRPSSLEAFNITATDSSIGIKQHTANKNLSVTESIEEILVSSLSKAVDLAEDSTLVTKEISRNENMSNQILLNSIDISELNINVNDFTVDAIDHIAFTGDNFLIRYSISSVNPITIEVNNELLTVDPKVIYQIEQGEINSTTDVFRPTFILFDIVADLGLGEAENIQNRTNPEPTTSVDMEEVDPLEIGSSITSSVDIDVSKTPPLLGTTIYLEEITEFIIKISWDEVTHQDLQEYYIYANNVRYGIVSPSELEYTFTNLEQETVYDIYVRPAYSEDKIGPHSNILTEHLIDIVSPKIPNKDLSISETINENEIIIEFEKAVDGLTPQHDLTYHLYRSEVPNLDIDPDNVETNGTLIATEVDVDHFIVSDVTEIYYFNIVVEDQAGNKNLYDQEMYDLPLTPGLKIGNGQVEYYQEDDQWYALHTFEESGEVIVEESGVGEICLIAGGGAGRNGGGGAGGVIITKVFLNELGNPVIVGTGGIGSNGNDSTFHGFTAIGGGLGADTGGPGVPGSDGGSGGGGWRGGSEGGLSLENQGNSGGRGASSGNGAFGGGGGGYSSAGVNATAFVPGNGGNGIEYPEGSENYHAGGGGGRHSESTSVGSPGLGGGFNNYGGGGQALNDGGSGVLFIRYPLVIEPITITPIPDQIVEGELQLELSDYFHHNFQDELEYSAVSNNSNTTVSVNGSVLTITGKELGNSDITVTATIVDQEAQQTFTVEVVETDVEIPNISSMYLDTNSYINLGNTLDIGTSDFTISMLIKTDNLSSQGEHIISKSVATGAARRWWISIQNGILSFRTSWNATTGQTNYNGPSVPNDGEYHHLSLSFDRDGELNMYVDFELGATHNISQFSNVDLTNSYNLLFGAYANGEINRFDGLIDEVQFWNKVLTREEIVEYGNKILTGNESGLVGYWNFEDRDPNQATDLTPNGNHGALVGNPVYEYNVFDFNNE